MLEMLVGTLVRVSVCSAVVAGARGAGSPTLSRTAVETDCADSDYDLEKTQLSL